jgi:hypothetical protein
MPHRLHENDISVPQPLETLNAASMLRIDMHIYEL